MINVVFLLLIFFLMSAQIVTPPPFDVDPPAAESDQQVQTELRLHVSGDGSLGFGDARDDAVWDALAQIDHASEAVLVVRADAALPGSDLARILSRLSPLGFAEIQLATVPK
ncbi:MAG: biopolymer transporter ExbD [Pseudomonadota bacterium]